MKKIIIFILFLIFVQTTNAEQIIAGPKTIDYAKKLFFENRKLDRIEGIWYNKKEKNYYAIVRNKDIKNKKAYDKWTIVHKVDFFRGKKDLNAKYILSGRYPDKSETYICSNTVYKLDNPLEQGVANGRCNLNQSHTLLEEYWKEGCWSKGICWVKAKDELEIFWPRNYKEHKRNQSLYVIGISLFLIGFLVFMVKLNRKNLLQEHNQNHKQKFKTYSELENHNNKIKEKESIKQQKKSEKEWKLEEERIKAEEEKQEREDKAKKLRIRVKKKEGFERQVKRKEESKYSGINENLGSSLKRLKKMYNNGHLTKVEFEKAKNKLLN